MKRAVSPLVAWVLIIGFSIAAGMFITRWVINEFSDLNFGQEKDVYCEDVSMDVDSVCICPSPDNNKIRVHLSNNGPFKLNRLYVGRTTSTFSKGWCNILSLGLDPGSIGDFTFQAGSPNEQYFSTRQTDCQTDLLTPHALEKYFGETEKLLELEIVPFVNVEDEYTPCYEKGILLNSVDQLNSNICSECPG